MALTCKNCGGNISLDPEANLIICDFCGANQPLNAVSDTIIFNETEGSVAQLNAYQQALAHLAAADTAEALSKTQKEFERLGKLFDAAQLAAECRERVTLLRTEQAYQKAVLDMQSDNPNRIKSAIVTFEQLGNYKESAIKLADCKPLLEQAQAKLDQQLQQIERDCEKRKIRRNRHKRFILFSFITILAVVLLVHHTNHTPANIKISVSPNGENYVTEKYNDYVFNYDVKIKNKSSLDLTAIQAEIYFEEPDGNVLLDADFNAGSIISSSNPVVRSKKSSTYTWSVTVSSKSTAKELYQYDFEKLKVKVKIKKLRYENGKVQSY